MATRTVTNSGNTEFVLEAINSTELQKLFFELKDNVQMQILNAAFRKSSKPILDTAKSNFESTKKGKSSTGYEGLASAFKTKALRKNVGMVIGMQHNDGYKYRFLNYGTAARFTKNGKKKRFTGIIKPSLFFSSAVTSKADEAQNMLSDEIILSLERCVKRYDKKAGK